MQIVRRQIDYLDMKNDESYINSLWQVIEARDMSVKLAYQHIYQKEREIYFKEEQIKMLAAATEEKEEQIKMLAATAEERLRLIEKLNEELRNINK